MLKRLDKRSLENLLAFITLASLSMLYFLKPLFSHRVLVMGDNRYALTVVEHVQHHFNQIFIHAPKMPFLLLLMLYRMIFGDISSEMLFSVTILFLSSSMVYLSNKHFLRRVSPCSKDWEISLSSLMGTLLFIYNPWTINKVTHHYWLVVSLSSSYLLLFRIDKMVRVNELYSFKEVLEFSALLALVLTQVQSVVIYAGVMIALYLLVFSILYGLEFLVWVLDRRVFITAVSSVLVDSWSVIPQLMTVLSGVTGPAGFGSYGKVVENVDLLSRRSSLLNTLRFSGGWLWGEPATPNYSLPFIGVDLWKILSLLPALIIALSLLLFFLTYTSKDERSYLIYFSILWAMSVILATGSYYPLFGDLYRTLFMKVPLGWVMRDPYKNTGLTVIAASFLYSTLAISALRLRKEVVLPFEPSRRKLTSLYSYFLLSLAFSSIILLGWPAATGNLNGHFDRFLLPFPDDLNYTLDLIRKSPDADKYGIFFYPLSGFHLSYADVPQMSISTLNTFREIGEFNGGFLNELFNTSSVRDLSSILKRLSVKYLVVRRDIIEDEGIELVDRSKEALQSSSYFKLVEERGNFSLYMLKQTRPLIYALPKVTCATYIDVSEGLKLGGYTSVPFIKDMIIISDKPIEFPINFQIVNPRSDHHRPKNIWSTGTFGGGWLNNFYVYIDKLGIKSWSTEESVVFTWSPYTLLTKEPDVMARDIIHRIDFERAEFLRVWHPDSLSIHLSNRAIEGNHSLAVKVSRGKDRGWKVLSTDYLEVNSSRWYQVRAWVSGKEVMGLHAKVYYYDEDRNDLGFDYLFLGRVGTFDWKEFSINVLTPMGTRYLRIMFWIKQNEKRDSCYWVDDIRVYDLRRFTVPNEISIPLTVKKNGSYILLIKVFKNRLGKAIQLQLSGRTFILNTRDDLNRFVWVKVGEFSLSAGKHILRIRELEGFNAIGLVALIPFSEYKDIDAKLSRILRNQTLLILMEAESEFYTRGGCVVEGWGASNGRYLELLPSDRAWAYVDIPLDGYYILALRVKGDVSFYLNNSVMNISSRNLSTVYLGPYHLTKGLHLLKLSSNSIYYKVAWDFKKREDLLAWRARNLERQFGAQISYSVDPDGSLEVCLHNSTWGWKTIKSPLIPANRSMIYRFSFEVKARNGSAIHLKISEYNSEGELLHMTYGGWVGDGSFDWKTITLDYEVKDPSTKYIGLEIWYGFETPYGLPNVILIRNFTVVGYKPAYFDNIWIYTYRDDQVRLEDIFGHPLPYVYFEKASPFLWRVRVNSTKPFLLVFSKLYDPFWRAKVHYTGKIVEIPPIMVNNMINGFWIDKGGNLFIEIVYKPYDWFLLGIYLSALTILTNGLFSFVRTLRSKGKERLKFLHTFTEITHNNRG